MSESGKTSKAKVSRSPIDLLDRVQPLLAVFVAIAILIGAAILTSAFLKVSARTTTAEEFSFTYDEYSGEPTPQNLLAYLAKSDKPKNLIDRDMSKLLLMSAQPVTNTALLKMDYVIELRRLHGTEAAFWVTTRPTDGTAPRALNRIVPEPTLSGIVLNIPAQSQPHQIVGTIRSTTLGKPKAFVWSAEQYPTRVIRSAQFGGALFGVFIGLAAFSLIVALLTRSLTYLLFGAWLITSLRIAAVNGGWNLKWLGLYLEPTALTYTMMITNAAHGVLTVALFVALFKNQISNKWFSGILRIAGWGCAALIPLAFIIPFGTFVRSFYLFTLIGFIGFGLVLARNLTRKFNPTSFWYAISFTLMMFGLLGEILYQADIMRNIVGLLNAQVATVCSALVLSVALAEQVRQDRKARLRSRIREISALQRLEDNYQASPIGLFTLDKNFSLQVFNLKVREMFSAQWRQAGNVQSLDDLCGPGTTDSLKSMLKNDDSSELEVFSKYNNSDAWYRIRLTAMDGKYDGVIEDITARKSAEDRLQHLVTHDALTGLTNRRGYDGLLAKTLKTASEQEPLILVEMTINRFSHVVTMYGTHIGELLLQCSAETLKRHCGQWHLARLGDTFRMIAPATDSITAQALMLVVRQEIELRVEKQQSVVRDLELCIGIVELTKPIDVARAQTYVAHACSLAHDATDNLLVLSAEHRALHDRFEELRVAQSLKDDIAEDRFLLHFQPIVAIGNPDAPVNFEVLLRMQGPDGGIIFPDKFIPAAEQSNMMPQIDRWVLRSIMDVLTTNTELRKTAGFFAINLSGASLNDSSFLDDVFEILSDRRWAASKLCFEVTESVALADSKKVRNFLHQLQSLGAKVALDDFGSGYSGWSYLHELHADILKIDGYTVKDILHNRTNALIVRSVCELSHQLNMECVAEWVEDQPTIDACIEMGVDFGQGWGLAKPVGIKEVLAVGADLHKLVKLPEPQPPNEKAQESPRALTSNG